MKTKTNQKPQKQLTMKSATKKVVKTTTTETTSKLRKLNTLPKRISESAEFLNVESSWVSRVIYEKEKRNLIVETKDGKIYMATEISPQKYASIKNAESVGSKINKLFNSLN
jgi:DNA-binding MarR family transcriptional regulator